MLAAVETRGDAFDGSIVIDDTSVLVGISANNVVSEEEGSVAVYVLVDHTCGNAILEYLERCDDGDLSSEVDCSATCAVEAGWSCTEAPDELSVCTDINECAVNNGGCNVNATCANSPGS
ncbi:hypothetical protein [Myxococcus landrumensis]|uniref:Lipoprotein n=1 Tax=Myxococcus landrumensis TaxID=2813577 RepID=A0ABX7NHX6_9BACT|nr:hypothetical protein [Myxococcus landrumus]QSQ18431.1 hypothetical protein JY572_27400 [Myxococcus landrumus]